MWHCFSHTLFYITQSDPVSPSVVMPQQRRVRAQTGDVGRVNRPDAAVVSSEEVDISENPKIRTKLGPSSPRFESVSVRGRQDSSPALIPVRPLSYTTSSNFSEALDAARATIGLHQADQRDELRRQDRTASNVSTAHHGHSRERESISSTLSDVLPSAEAASAEVLFSGTFSDADCEHALQSNHGRFSDMDVGVLNPAVQNV